MCADMQRQMMLLQQGGPWIQARNFAVFSGVSAGISVAMRRIRKKEDVRNVYVPSFISADNIQVTSAAYFEAGSTCCILHLQKLQCSSNFRQIVSSRSCMNYCQLCPFPLLS